MKFDDIVFDQQGCCGSHTYAVVRHENGKVSTVYDNGDGSYDVVTHSANLLMRGQEKYADVASLIERLGGDAA